MERFTLGKTGLQVSRVGIGGIPIQRPSPEEATRVIRRALDLGINFVDTSIGYGDSEERIGRAIAGRREEVVVATKGGWQDRETVLRHVDISLERLGIDTIDLWQFHGINTMQGYESIFEPGGAMEGAQEALGSGKIRHLGVSSHSFEVALEAVRSGHFETLQFPLNFISNEAVEGLLPLARRRDVGFIAMKPFAGGNIRDANLALKYVLQFEHVLPDPGVERVEEVEEIAAIVNAGEWELTEEEHDQIRSIRAQLGSRFCRQCGYCLPCEQGVNIPLVMIGRIMHRLWPAELFNDPEWWFWKAVDTAENCIECGVCEERCPYRLSIRQVLADNRAFLAGLRP
jgi:hypothetical protein